jgi:glycosyltransferase involved in cell wall biosynthesis
MSKKILILTPFFSPNIGGAETFTDGLVKEAKKCHKITVLTFQPFNQRLPNYMEEDSVKIYRMNWWLKQSHAWKGVSLRNALSVIPQMVWSSIFLILRNRYDIIHAQGLLSGFVAVLLKKIFKVKAYVTLLALYEFNNWPRNIKYKIARWVLKESNLIFVEGENGRFDISDWTFLLHHKIKEFNHWVDQSVFCPPEERSNDKIKVLFIGRPIPEKGRHIIEEAEKILNNPKYDFTYVENIKKEDLPGVYQMADIVVVPSLYAEGFSLVVAEAASCGCAVITSNRGSLPEMVYGFGFPIEPTGEEFAINIKVIGDFLGWHYGNTIRFAKDNFSSKNSEVFLESYN